MSIFKTIALVLVAVAVIYASAKYEWSKYHMLRDASRPKCECQSCPNKP
jgi:hypothetical protein